jgi:hypothetical protein
LPVLRYYKITSPIGSIAAALSPKSISAPKTITIPKSAKEAVDENNEVVVVLLKVGSYTVEQCIDAVDRCGTSEMALEFLEDGGSHDGDGGIQYFREDSADADW